MTCDEPPFCDVFENFSICEVLTLDCVKSFYRTRYFEKRVISCATVRKLGGIHSNNGGDFGESVEKSPVFFLSFSLDFLCVRIEVD